MNKKLNITGEEYKHRVRQQAKARTIRFREEQEKRGYKNLGVYLSEPFRTELERLADEKGLNRQNAMDHIFGVYQQNVNNAVTSNAVAKTEETPENAANLGIENEDAKFNTEFYLVDVKAITPAREIKDSELDAVDQWVRSILQFDSLVTPLVLKQTGPEKFTVVEGHTRFFAAVKAREIDPRKFEMIGAIVISDVTSNAISTDGESIETPVNPKPLETESIQPAKISEQKPVEEPASIPEPEDNDGIDQEPDQPMQEVQAEMFDAVQEPVEPKPDQNMELPDYLVNVNPDMPIEDRHKIVLRLAEDYPGRKNAQIRIDILNAAGILLNGKPWERTKQFTDQLSIARRWAKKQKQT